MAEHTEEVAGAAEQDRRGDIPKGAATPGRPGNRRGATRTIGLIATTAVALAVHGAGGRGLRAAEPTGKPWIDMDYGPYLTASFEVDEGNIAHKGIAIRLDAGEGGVSAGTEFAVFDTDTLRWAAGWVGPGFCDWKSIVWDGSHQTHPSIAGEVIFKNPVGPGWAEPGTRSFEDRRVEGRDGVRYGPLERDWARWKGLYLHGPRVVLAYTVGDTAVLESPSSESSRSARAIARTLDIGPRSESLSVRVAWAPDSVLELRPFEGARSSERRLALILPETTSEESRKDSAGVTAAFELDGATVFEVARSEDFDLTGADFTIWARIRTREGGTIFAKAPREGKWVPDGKTLFVRGGRLCYDIGWVGVATSRSRVNDGRWHDVAVTSNHRTGKVRIFVDGKPETERPLAPRERVDGHTVRVGYTSPNFPEKSAFRGAIGELRVYRRRLEPEEIRALSEGDEVKEKVEAGAKDIVARWGPSDRDETSVEDASGAGHTARRRRIGAPPAAPRPAAIAVIGGPEGTRWIVEDRELRLHIPAGTEPARLKLVHVRAEGESPVESAARIVESVEDPRDLEPLTRGGPPRWPEIVRARRTILGPANGPFVVESLGTPMENPWRAWMRPGGFDFFEDGDRAAVCTWQGDVWVVDGLGGEIDELGWRRIATGLFQPLGLVIAGGTIHVLGRDQITRLHDLDGDGETDFYECFNNDAQVTEHFHEFAMDLQRDAEGNFYYTKGGRHALDSVVPQHGTLLRVSKDGERTDIVAYGFRAPNGLCVNDDGTFIVSDQEGHWTPENRINWVEPGGFYGYLWAYHRGERPESYDPPLLWVDHDTDRSPAEQLWVPRDTWGPLGGKLLALAYGVGKVQLVLHEEVDGKKQGAVIDLPVTVLPTGIMRGRFHPRDRQLYACGLFGWSSDRTFPGGFYRIRRTETPLHVPIELHATRKGVFLRFSEPLERRRAARTGSYRVTRWNYRWRARYGSDDFRVSDGKPGREEVPVGAVRVSEDGRSVFLEIGDMRPSMQQKIEYRLRAADGARMSSAIFHTIHALGSAERWLEEAGS